MIAVLDYGAGNLRSVQNTLEAIGTRFEVVRDTAGLRRGAKILLPGVGNFGQMMRALDRLEVRETLKGLFKYAADFTGANQTEKKVIERFGMARHCPRKGFASLNALSHIRQNTPQS